MMLDVGDKFTSAVAALDEKKCFSHGAFKESAGLPRAYCLEFVDWLASPGSTINTNTVSQNFRYLKCLYQVRSHVSAKATQRSTKANVCLLASTHIRCFLIPLPDVALFHCQQ